MTLTALRAGIRPVVLSGTRLLAPPRAGRCIGKTVSIQGSSMQKREIFAEIATTVLASGFHALGGLAIIKGFVNKKPAIIVLGGISTIIGGNLLLNGLPTKDGKILNKFLPKIEELPFPTGPDVMSFPTHERDEFDSRERETRERATRPILVKPRRYPPEK